MEVIAKKSKKYITRYRKTEEVREAMERLKGKHLHLCDSCACVLCAECSHIKSSIVKTGIFTPEDEVVLECSDYRDRETIKAPEEVVQNTEEHLAERYGQTYRIAHPTVRKRVDRMK